MCGNDGADGSFVFPRHSHVVIDIVTGVVAGANLSGARASAGCEGSVGPVIYSGEIP
jgi:hypothetical protein